MTQSTSIARRYAMAIVDAAVAQNNLDAVTKELEAFAALVKETPDLRHLLLSPVFTSHERQQVLTAVLTKARLSELTTRLLALLSERNRFGVFEDVARAVRRLADARANKVRAEVHAAAPLSPDATESLRRALEKRTGKSVEMNVLIDPSLLGGVRARIGSTVLDGTLRSQLEQLRETLLRA